MRISEDTKLDFSDVLLVPKRSELNSRSEVELCREFTFKYHSYNLTCCPIIASNMYNTGTIAMGKELAKKTMLVTLHKYYKTEELAKQDWNIIPTFGLNDYNKISEFISLDSKNNPNIQSVICIDVPNGYIPKVSNMVKKLRDKYNESILIIVGNVVTPNLTEQLILDGADIIKVGIGSGALCTTRLVTGVGYPQLSAISECADAAHGLGGHIISDGGITCIGDICKAFCAGADFVMIGSMFMGYEENEGEWLYETKANERLEYPAKKTRLNIFGMSSKTANEVFAGGLKDYRASEGRESVVKYKGPIAPFLQEIEGGLRSCGTYIGAKRIKDFPKCASFIKVNNTHNRSLENA